MRLRAEGNKRRRGARPGRGPWRCPNFGEPSGLTRAEPGLLAGRRADAGERSPQAAGRAGPGRGRDDGARARAHGTAPLGPILTTSGDRAAQPERQQHPQRSGAQSGHLLGRLLRRGPGRSTWGGVPTKEPPLSPPHLPLLRLTASRSAPKFRLKCLHSPHPKSAAPEPPPQPPPEVC